MNAMQTFALIVACLGAFFVFVAGLGIWRFKDVYMRMHAATKAGSLGLGLLLLAVAIQDPTPAVIIKCFLIIAFIFLTAPIAAHMISRAAYIHQSELSDKTRFDELEGKYSADRSKLKG
jgi:multicomponent Na+:H+ antiporter subunit G